MKKWFFSLALITSSIFCFSQRNEPFNLLQWANTTRADSSLYSAIAFLDSRADTSFMGIVQKGITNNKANVVADPGFATQFQQVLDSIIPKETGQQGELLLQLSTLKFRELSEFMTEQGYCNMRMNLYSKTGDEYRLIKTLDTLVHVSAGDVTRKLFKSSSAVMIDFIKANINKQPTGSPAFSLAHLRQIDRYEKSRMPLYTRTQYTDGIYLSYEALKMQTPDNMKYEIMSDGDKGIRGVKAISDKGKAKKMNSRDVYAVIHNNHIFIATPTDFIRLIKKENDFMFYGVTTRSAEFGDVLMGGLAYGVVGAIVASAPVPISVRIKVDHLKGQLMVIN